MAEQVSGESKTMKLFSLFQETGREAFVRSCALVTRIWVSEAGVAQLAEHQPSKLRVAGSIPVSRSIFLEFFF